MNICSIYYKCTFILLYYCLSNYCILNTCNYFLSNGFNDLIFVFCQFLLVQVYLIFLQDTKRELDANKYISDKLEFPF